MKKTYFIGLGGSGLKTVSQIQKKVHQLPNADDYLFTYIDSDSQTLKQINMDENLINFHDYFDLGGTNPYQLYMQAKASHDEKAKRLLEWAIDSPNLHPNQELADGAMACRMVGRFGLYCNAEKIKREFTRKLQQFQGVVDEIGSPVVPDIWVITSCCGGTGSAIVLDILYLIDRIVQFDLHYGMSPDVKLVLYMPMPFIDENKGNPQYFLNAFATLWEINAFRAAYLQDSHIDKFGPYAATPPSVTWNTNVGFPLFNYVIPIDAESDKSFRIPLEDLYPTVAELVCSLLVCSLNDCIQIHPTYDPFLLKKRSYNDTLCDWTTPLVAYGYKVIRKPNDELKHYLKTRGMLEIIKFGLLGNDVEEKERETIKVNFASEYILSWIMDTEYCKATGNSLQAKIEGVYNTIFPLKTENLETKIVANRINQVEMVAQNLNKIENDVFEEIKKQINKGTSEAIHSHGLKYTWTLLRLVDDYFLENDVKEEMMSQLSELYHLVDAKKSEVLSLCENVEKFPAFLFGRKSKREQCVASFNEYKQYEMQYHTLRSAINIIQKLTRQSTSYLEILRHGSSENVGLRQLIDLARCAQSKLEEDYIILHKEFCDSVINIHTINIPSLESIAKDTENQYWPKGSIFDIIYTDTILDYDRDKECVSEYLKVIDANRTLFVDLALKDKNRIRDSFNDDVLGKIGEQIDLRIVNPLSLASRWLNMTLDNVVAGMRHQAYNTDNSFFDLIQLANPDNIKVLYPMKSGVEAPIERFVYVGASVNLAQDMGFNPMSCDQQFVSDTGMTDKLFIIKMQVGLDFYSYSHMPIIEHVYEKVRQEIKAFRAYESGCHIHKKFAEMVGNLND